MIFRKILLAALLFYSSAAIAQRTDYPLIGAQIFIEPGQTPEQIDHFFSVMKQHGMEVGRIRMFGAHMQRPDGAWDFSLYDHAFDAAQRNGVRLFATLFPTTDELTDVGGFKFPRSKAHLSEIATYIEAIVTHFRNHPALYCWVLQNEPGTGGTKVPPTDLSREKLAEWKVLSTSPPLDNKFLQADFADEKFLTWYTTWYLAWIASQVDMHDPGRYKHVNPHQILSTLPEYDFTAYRSFLTSLGASMHMSWHFGWFTRAQYPLGVSVMSDLIREGACGNPFWITELQGGNVTASGQVPYCPTGEEIAQYLWTGIAAGSQGVIFWTLNQRASVMEAGEWGMLDFQGNPSDRLRSAADVISKVKANMAFFRDAQPVLAPITLLYNVESMRIQRRNAGVIKDEVNEGRQADAPMKSLVSAYEALTALGVTPRVVSMERFEWDKPEGQVAIIPDMVGLPTYYWDGIRTFVRGGGTLLITGLSGYYDENMRCIMMGGFPLRDCFGGEVTEFKATTPYFALGMGDQYPTLSAHLWRGTLAPSTGMAIASESGSITAMRNAFGRGQVIWIPSPVELGAWHRDNTALTEFYRILCSDALSASPIRFAEPAPNILMRSLRSGNRLMTVLVNKNDTLTTIRLSGEVSSPILVDGHASAKELQLTLPAHSHIVYLWEVR